MKSRVKHSIKSFLFFTISVLSAGLLSVSCVSTSNASDIDSAAAPVEAQDLANPPAKQEAEEAALVTRQERSSEEQAAQAEKALESQPTTNQAAEPADSDGPPIIEENSRVIVTEDAEEAQKASESQPAEERDAIEEPVIYDLPLDEAQRIPSDTETEAILEIPVLEELVEADFPERNSAAPAASQTTSGGTEAQNEIQASDSAQTPTAAISPRETVTAPSQREAMTAQNIPEVQDDASGPSAAEKDLLPFAGQMTAALEDSPLADKAPPISSALSAVPPVPSRSVSIKRNQYLDIEYPGSGWVFMGGTEKENKMTFFGKRISSENTVFILRSRFPGTTLLHFYKNDLLAGNYIDDYLEVIIENETAESLQTHVKAPSYADMVPPEPDRTLLEEKQTTADRETENPAKADFAQTGTTENPNAASSALSGTRQTRPQSALKSDSVQTAAATQAAPTSINAENPGSSAGRTVVQATGSDGRSYQVQEAQNEENSATDNMTAASGRNQTVESENTAVIINQNQNAEVSEANDMTSSDILKNAQEAYDKGLYEKSLSLLTDFFEKSQTDVDKALYLQGQNFEAESPIKNIKNAIDSYDTIVKNFRQSPLWRSARERSIYLKRFYIDIR
ncbi:hypothetical protein HRI96_03795 [Treponema parvum]|uniref:Lipoprotein n=1 Tax=Treponema parvum TaxID=138851 RepID=A0A975EZ93_9SPIR|nr:hypothetical protein [Treponema parvum]QTQ11395.1 hypothetical protein HRI96_03795 [Treponema parvum]